VFGYTDKNTRLGFKAIDVKTIRIQGGFADFSIYMKKIVEYTPVLARLIPYPNTSTP
jgi:hypothetical protein